MRLSESLIIDYTFHTFPQSVSLPMMSQAVQKNQFYRAIVLIYWLHILLLTIMCQITESKRYVIYCGFIQTFICFSLCKFMNRLLSYLSRQRIRKLNTVDTHLPEPDTSTFNSGNLSSKLHLDTGFPFNLCIKTGQFERVIHTSNHCNEICDILGFYVT